MNDSNGPQYLVTVFLSIHIALNIMQLCSLSAAYACAYHNPTATMRHYSQSWHEQTLHPHNAFHLLGTVKTGDHPWRENFSKDLAGEEASCGGPGLAWFNVIYSCKAGWMYSTGKFLEITLIYNTQQICAQNLREIIFFLHLKVLHLLFQFVKTGREK